MLNRKTAFLALVIAAASGTLALLAHANGTAHGPTPSRVSINPIDLMSKADHLPELKIENLF